MNTNENNDIWLKGKKKKKSRPEQVAVIPETVEIPVTEIVDQQLQHRSTEVSIILGDSIVQSSWAQLLIEESRSWNCGQTFSGATAEELESYTKPTLNKSPTTIIRHARTSVLKSREPT